MYSLADKILKTVVSLLRVIIRSKRVKISNEKLDLGDECFVIGNGPSLNSDFTKYSEEIKATKSICVNFFAKSHLYDSIKPSYYVLIDPVFYKKKVASLLGESRLGLFNRISESTVWKMKLFIPFRCEIKNEINEIIASNKNVDIVYFNANPFEGFEFLMMWFFKRNLAVPYSQNVLVAALFIALNLGYKKCYLIGADHSWHQEIVVADNNIVCLKDRHFSDKAEPELKPWYKGHEATETWRMSEIFLALSKMFSGYELVEKYSKVKGAKVYNCSENSFIDSFERK